MNILVIILFTLVAAACGRDSTPSGQSELTEIGDTAELPVEDSEVVAVPEESAAVQEEPESESQPPIPPVPESEPGLLDTKIAEMDLLILDRVAKLSEWRIWDDMRDKIRTGDYDLLRFLDSNDTVGCGIYGDGCDNLAYRWFYGNGTSAESDWTGWVKDWRQSKFNGKRQHCDEWVDVYSNEFWLHYPERRGGVYLSSEIYAYWPQGEEGPGYITRIELKWKTSTDTQYSTHSEEATCAD